MKLFKGIIAGSFDLIHPGYVRMFKESKEYCDYLIVALQDDPTFERPNKCKPVQTLSDRKEILTSLKYVDEVLTYSSEESLHDLLRKTDYDVRILGEEYKNCNFTGKDLGKSVLWIQRRHDYSTTALKEKIYEERKLFHDQKLSNLSK
jgi:glycerol-3-phosphate cytidylyltransferase